MMIDAYAISSKLLASYLNHELSLPDFQRIFIARFKAESLVLDEPLFLLLDELFAVLDSYTDDMELLASDPSYYLDEPGVERKAAEIAARMGEWHARAQLASANLR
ncbi:colicin immunity domain-containing protein [Rugamonas sp. DEMB1]|uniref:colicin immunity domain-containing protein n=1 Tax=Rugamonas sp. DEMB1 TaxID=3039386 RepID=UPI0024489295|nr:colicin immunity domain-containing protein [Rugamonas sp. DEMB1]WGG51393.1 colicin immunity domain-containing protein [Rugamonas sp. DEMB1]